MKADLPGTIVTGFTTVPSPSTIGPQIVVTVTPKECVTEVHLKITGTNRIEIADPSVNTGAGTITFKVKGKDGGTPASAPNKSDTELHTTCGVNGPILSTAKVTVLVPDSLRQGPNPIWNGNVTPQNVALHRGTIPPVPSSPGLVWLETTYLITTTLQVLDQFGDPLSNLYAGAPVDEFGLGNQWLYINRNVDGSGTYQDVMGRMYFRGYPNAGNYAVPAGSPEANDWPNQPKLFPLPGVEDTQGGAALRVGGHVLDPGLQNQRIISTPPQHLEIFFNVE